MAFPVILVDSATGSDSAASGAGPSTALSGSSNASTSGTGLVVTLPSGTVLTGVSTTGSDVIYLADSTAGNRNFGKITATSGSGGATPTVTVSAAFGASLTGKSWAIGGKRASLGSSSGVRLVNNNNASADASAGWAVELQDGHSESIAAFAASIRCVGDTTSGPFTLRAAAGVTTRPVLRCADNGNQFIVVYGTYVVIDGIDFRYDAAANSTNAALYLNAIPVVVRDCRIYSNAPSSYTWGYGIWFAVTQGTATNCWVSDCSTAGIYLASAGGRALHCRVSNVVGTGNGIAVTSDGGAVVGCVVGGSIGGKGITLDRSASSPFRPLVCVENTVYGTAGDGINVVDGLSPLTLLNNLLVSCGGYGVNFNSATLVSLQSQGVRVLGHGFSSCTSGTTNAALTSLLVGGQTSATLDNGSFGTSSNFTPGPASNLQTAYPSTRLGVS